LCEECGKKCRNMNKTMDTRSLENESINREIAR
jgi:hypothetical protein